MFDKILIVCMGNICRSPTGERLLKKYMPGKTIRSAGIKALIDHAADSTAELIAERHGISLNGHRAVQVTREICRNHELILVMERKHIDALYNIVPEAKGKIMLFGHWNSEEEIADPYKKSVETFESVFHSLDRDARKWAEKINY